MKLLITGRPGAGKGTQAANIKEYYNIPHISTGDMFRAAMSNGTKLGMLAKEYMSKGQLVPDEVTIGIVEERLLEADCKDGFLLDGFPRTIAQADALNKFLLQNNITLDAVLDVDVAKEILVRRMVGRRVCKNCGSTFHTEFNKPMIEGICDNCKSPLIQRPDDNEETANSRLDVYDSQTQPILAIYDKQGILKRVNGDQSFDAVFDDIKKTLGAE